MTPEQKASAINQMRRTPGWQLLVQEFYQRREKIIAEGKKGRAEEKQRRMWAMLDGFDEAATLAERLGDLPQVIQPDPEGEDE